MGIWTILWLVVIAAIGAFAVLNWHVLTVPTAINVLVAQVTAPLGLVLLGAMAAVALLFLLFLVWLETKALIQMGRPGSRFTADAMGGPIAELRSELERELGELKTEHTQAMREVGARLEHLDRTVNDSFRELSGARAMR